MTQGTKQISIIIPARDEEKHLPKCLGAIEKAALSSHLNVELIVVINRCSDRTEEIAREAGAIIIHCDAKNLSIIRSNFTCGHLVFNKVVIAIVESN